MEALSDILLLPSISISLFVDSSLFLLLFYAFFLSLSLLKNYNKSDTSNAFYKLENRSHLLVTIVTLSIFIKILLLPFFLNTLNTLTAFIPGAMCSAGVISANEFGNPTLFFKLATLLIALLWLRLNNVDEVTPKQPYFQKKLWLFNILFFSIAMEFFLEIAFFTHLVTDSPVMCCTSIFNTNTQKDFLITLPHIYLLILFIVLFFSSILLKHYKKRFLSSLSILLFSYIAYYTLVYILSPYIYELPTHKCPYCMMQNEYYGIGYFIYISIFMALYYSCVSLFFNFDTKDYKKSSFYLTLFFLLTLSSFVLYLAKNETLLSPLF